MDFCCCINNYSGCDWGDCDRLIDKNLVWVESFRLVSSGQPGHCFVEKVKDFALRNVAGLILDDVEYFYFRYESCFLFLGSFVFRMIVLEKESWNYWKSQKTARSLFPL